MGTVTFGTSKMHGVRAVDGRRILVSGPAVREECWVVEEDILSVDVAGVGVYLLMWTPTASTDAPVGYMRSEGLLAELESPEALALAAGFCFTEGLIDGIDDIRAIAMCPDRPGVVRVDLVDPSRPIVRRRQAVVASSCGMCGSREAIENELLGLSPVPDTLRLSAEQLENLMAVMRERQSIFLQTGGTHAAAVFGSDGAILATAEDLGRHNALDKVIGLCLLQEQDLRACGVLLSSRLSCEMVVKAARAKFELVAAVSAPTSLAIDVGTLCGMTLCGFVRDGRATIYTHPRRVVGVTA
jgi:FdhD protein